MADANKKSSELKPAARVLGRFVGLHVGLFVRGFIFSSGAILALKIFIFAGDK